jgi:hypothetical protein
MKLFLDRRVALDDSPCAATVVTERRKWSKGWVALLVNGNRRFLRENDAQLSNQGNGRLTYVIAEPGHYEADSACASLKAHRVRFDVDTGGVIVVRRSAYPRRCHHLRWWDDLAEAADEVAAGDALAVLTSLSSGERPSHAAILLGGQLERHLRRLCEDRGLVVSNGTWAKGIGDLSSALKSAGVYPKATHKVVLDLAALRKRAQHQAEQVSAEEVSNAVDRLVALLRDHPASRPVTREEGQS